MPNFGGAFQLPDATPDGWRIADRNNLRVPKWSLMTIGDQSTIGEIRKFPWKKKQKKIKRKWKIPHGDLAMDELCGTC